MDAHSVVHNFLAPPPLSSLVAFNAGR